MPRSFPSIAQAQCPRAKSYLTGYGIFLHFGLYVRQGSPATLGLLRDIRLDAYDPTSASRLAIYGFAKPSMLNGTSDRTRLQGILMIQWPARFAESLCPVFCGKDFCGSASLDVMCTVGHARLVIHVNFPFNRPMHPQMVGQLRWRIVMIEIQTKLL
jgi:hypothetical protein